MNILIFLLILLVLVISHEFGHFIVAKRSGMRVDEFSFGFPPKLFGIKKGETSYNFNALPFGGYVKIFGENPDEDSINGKGSNRSFVNKPFFTQAAVLVAGIFMNLVLAWFLFSICFMSGLPTSLGQTPIGAKLENQALTITLVSKSSPADKAGLLPGDAILSMKTKNDSTETPSVESVQYFIKRHPSEPITLTYSRAGVTNQTEITPANDVVKNSPAIGVGLDIIGTLKLPFVQAIGYGFNLTIDSFANIIKGFGILIGNAFRGHGSLDDISGPVGITQVVGQVAKLGFIYLMSFTAFISINLAVINLIPFPALDGGRLLFLFIEKIKGSRIKPKIANIANAVGFSILMILMAVVTYHDILKLL